MNYKSVTIWHKEKDCYKRILFEKALAAEIKAVSGSAAGEKKCGSAVVRVYSLYDCGISPGDCLCVGYEEALYPPPDAYIITEVCGFFTGSAVLRHYRLKCA